MPPAWPGGKVCRASGGDHCPFPEKLCCYLLLSELPVAPQGPFFSPASSVLLLLGGSASCWLNPGQFSDVFSCYIHLLRSPVLLLSLGLVESPSHPCFSLALAPSRTRSCSGRTEAGSWWVLWLSTGAAGWSGARRSSATTSKVLLQLPDLFVEKGFVSRGSESRQPDPDGSALALQIPALWNIS